MDQPRLSVVIPVFNEEAGLPALFARLYPALDALQRCYECIFIDDGSEDRSVALLREMFQRRPAQTRVVVLRGNFGQHSAILAGFERARGDFVVTLDADLQNPPEERARPGAAPGAGGDACGGTCRQRPEDAWWRRRAPPAKNRGRGPFPGFQRRARVCMLRGFP